jgi:alpha-galactosidase
MSGDLGADTGVAIIRLEASDDVRLDRVELTLGVTASRVLEHGWQSWSAVRPTSPLDIRPVRANAPRWFRHQMLVNGDSAGLDVSGDSFLVSDVGVVGLLGSTAGARIRVRGDGEVVAEWLLDGRLLKAGDRLDLDPLWWRWGNPDEGYPAYLEASGRAMNARPFRPIPAGWCTWYQYFGDLRARDVTENLVRASELGLEVVQIDDGYQPEIGIWDRASNTWGETLAHTMGEVAAGGFAPGIWTAPFAVIEGGEVATRHPEWLVRKVDGTPRTALVHPGWGGRVFALDTTRLDVLEHVTQQFLALAEIGVSYFKIDFCHVAAVPGVRHDPLSTRLGALRRGLEAVRAGIGEQSYLVGCGCPLLAAVGVVDAMRVSEDVAPFFEPRYSVPGFIENTVAARNAIEASVRRAPMHRRWFALDPDCVLLRATDTDLTAKQRDLVADVALATSGSIVLSDRLDLYGPKEMKRASDLLADRQDVVRDLRGVLLDTVELRWSDRTLNVDLTRPRL